ncbi:MAG: translation initiation factor IF-2 [Rickettsia sp.]|nr:translation initiation factor IF-2 [Rickettsia sp.]
MAKITDKEIKKNKENKPILLSSKNTKRLFLRQNSSTGSSFLKSNKLVVEIKQGKAIKNEFSSLNETKQEKYIPTQSDFEKKIQLIRNANADQKEAQELDTKLLEKKANISNDNKKTTQEEHISIKEDDTKIVEKKIENIEESKNTLYQSTNSENKENKENKKHSSEGKIFQKPYNETPPQEKPEHFEKIAPNVFPYNKENIRFSKKDKIKEDSKRVRSNLITSLDQESGDIIEKRRSLASFKRAQEKFKRKQQNITAKPAKVYREINIDNEITINELANKLSELSSKVVHELKKLGVKYESKEQILSRDIAELIAVSLGHSVKISTQINLENILKIPEDNENNLETRPPVVAFMGHVDHGKTSLLDSFRATDVVSGESGGITQHIGSYNVKFTDNSSITFIDTPGHEAFVKIRSRSSSITDIVVLVISAEDGIKAQTIEAIKHTQESKVPIIVAINKIDKNDSTIDKIKGDLLSYDIISEDLGGDVMVVNVSAKKKINLDKLRESILLLAEMLSLKANYKAMACGVILESRIDIKIGNISNLLVQRGNLKIGDIIIAGTSMGKVKNIIDDFGKNISELTPSMVANISGFDVLPDAGEKFYVLESEQNAYNIISYRKKLQKKISEKSSKKSIEDLFAKPKIKNIFLIIKSDVYSSMDAIYSSISQIKHPEIFIKIINMSIGNINLTDINLAITSNASIIGFNIKTDLKVQNYADRHSIDIHNFTNIYQVLDFIKARVSSLISPTIKETCIGHAKVRQVFNLTKTGQVIGSYVTDGIIKNNNKVQIFRKNKLIHEDFINSIKQLKNHVKEVRSGLECGITLKNLIPDIQVEDILKIYEITEEKNIL